MFSEVRRQFCLYAFVCAPVILVSYTRAERTHSLRSLSYMPGFGLCFRGSVIIQGGKQPAPDLISCRGSHREVGKHYQLITVLPASPALSSDSPAKRRLSFSSFSFCVLCVVSDPPPAAAHVSVGCVRPVLLHAGCQTDSRGEPTHGKGKA